MPTMKICPVCGKEFLSRNGAKYCGDKCRRIQESRRCEEYRKRQVMKVPPVKACPICGTKCTAHGSAVYCSDGCRRRAAVKWDADYRKGISVLNRRLQKMSEIQCAYCGKIMTKDEVYYVDPAEENWIFCSRECAIGTMSNKFFAMKEAGEIVDKVDDLDLRNVNTVR